MLCIGIVIYRFAVIGWCLFQGQAALRNSSHSYLLSPIRKTIEGFHLCGTAHYHAQQRPEVPKQNRQVLINLQNLNMGLLDSYPVSLSWPSLLEGAFIANDIKWQ